MIPYRRDVGVTSGTLVTNRCGERAQKPNTFEPDRPRGAVTPGAVVIPGEGNDMDDATWRHTGLPLGHAQHNQGRRKAASISRTAALQLLGSVVYAARLADGTIKIGWTTQLQDRLRYLACYTKQDVELLAFAPGGYDDEQAIHRSLVGHRRPGRREYYRPAPEVMVVVNDMRAALNMPPVAA